MDRKRDDTLPFTEEFRPPCREQEQSRRKSEQESSLRHKQREEKIFPLKDLLRIHPIFLDQEKSADSVIEEERRQRHSFTPPPKGNAREGGTDEATPDESDFHWNTDSQEHGIEKITPQGIPHRVSRQDWATRPPARVCSHPSNEREMKGQITEVVRGEDFPFVAHGIDQPEKGASRSTGKDQNYDPTNGPDGPGALCLRKKSQKTHRNRHPTQKCSPGNTLINSVTDPGHRDHRQHRCRHPSKDRDSYPHRAGEEPGIGCVADCWGRGFTSCGFPCLPSANQEAKTGSRNHTVHSSIESRRR